jgi:hypothetical protein
VSDELKITPWPSTPEEHRWHRFLEAAVRKWGYERVPAAQVYAAFDQKVAVALPGFRLLAQGRHCRSISDDITHLLSLRALKGGMYVVSFGVVLSFVPVRSGKKLVSSRISARAHPTVWDEPGKRHRYRYSENLRAMFDPLTDTDLIGGVHTLNGAGFLEYTLDHHWRDSLPQVQSWFDSNETLEGVLQTSRTQLKGARQYSTHYPPQALVVAFLLARLGRADEARDQFRAWRETSRSDDEPAWDIKVEQVIAQAS